jgi:hypothetical protein
MVVVLFILLLSSLLWLMTAQHITATIQRTQQWWNYYQAYYRAYWWIEYWLTLVAHHGFGFQTEKKRDNTEVRIISRAEHIDGTLKRSKSGFMERWGIKSECTIESAWIIKPWEWLVIPMFLDASNPFEVKKWQSFSVREIKDAGIYLQSIARAWTLIHARIIDDEWLYMMSWRSWPTGTTRAVWEILERWVAWDNPNNQKFLVIRWENEEIGICITSKIPLPTPIIWIEAKWKAWPLTIILTAKKNTAIPSYLLFWVIAQE